MPIVEYAGHLFRHSRGDGGRAVLHKVMTNGRTDSVAWLKAALLLEQHGHLVLELDSIDELGEVWSRAGVGSRGSAGWGAACCR